MKTYESILKNKLQKKIEWANTEIYVAEETKGEMTNAAWSVFKGIYTALKYAREQEVFK